MRRVATTAHGWRILAVVWSLSNVHTIVTRHCVCHAWTTTTTPQLHASPLWTNQSKRHRQQSQRQRTTSFTQIWTPECFCFHSTICLCARLGDDTDVDLDDICPSLPQFFGADGIDSIDTPNAVSKGGVSSRRSFATTAAAATILASLGATDSSGLGTVAAAASLSSLSDDEVRRIAIFEKTSPSVVFIDSFTERRDSLSTNVMEVPLGSGSGFVWDRQGHIVTNYHVVRNAKSAQVAILLNGSDAVSANKLVAAEGYHDRNSGSGSEKYHRTTMTTANNNNNVYGSGGGTLPSSMRPGSSSSKDKSNSFRRVFTSKIVGLDPGKDIAVLQIEADPAFLFPITLGTSAGLKVGQQALAIGNPFGLDHTLTAGIISGTGREVKSPIGRPITDVIQTDAAINPGNSGGPLLDSSGKLIGMNTAIYSPSGASAGIGFAIPVDAVKFIVETLIRDGKVVRPVLGISYLGSKQARTLGIQSGVLVLEVPAGSPAAKAGLKGTRRTDTGLIEIGDIITKVGAQMINKEADLFEALEDLKPGDVVEVTVSRVVANNDELTVREVILAIELQPNTQIESMMMLQQYNGQ